VRLATRLTLLIAAVTLLVALSVGWFAISMSSRAQFGSLNDAINTVVDSGQGNHLTALTNALYSLQQNSYDLNLDVVFASGAVSQINTASIPLKTRPTLGDVRSSLAGVTSLAHLPGFEVRSLNIGDGDFLLVAGSTLAIRRQNQHLALGVGAASLAIALLGVMIGRVVIRRDLRVMERLITYAGGLANGAAVTDMPSGEGSLEIQELRSALVVMVEALHRRIELETKSANTMQEFIDDASHELRTPLTVLKGYNELLSTQATTSPEQHQRALDRMSREIARMESLVGDLLLIAQLRELPSRELEVVNLSAAVGARLDDFSSEHPERTVDVELEEGLRVRGREDFLERLIVNALTNITRHTDRHDEVRVRLAARGARAELTIEDAGPGLPVYGERPQRFQRYDDSRSRDTGGSGLGMSIMADVAESMGGTFTTRASSLGGLAIDITLPLAAVRP